MAEWWMLMEERGKPTFPLAFLQPLSSITILASGPHFNE